MKEQLFQDAIKNYNKSIILAPTFADAYNNLGLCYNKIKKYKKAEYNFKKAIKNNPLNGNFYLNLYQIYHLLNKPKLAIRCCKINRSKT